MRKLAHRQPKQPPRGVSPIWKDPESWILGIEDPASASINVELYRRDCGGGLYHMSAPLFIYLLFWNMQLHHHKSSISGHTYILRHTHWSMSGEIGAEQGLSQRQQRWAGYRGLPCLQANSFWWIPLEKRHAVEIKSRWCGFNGRWGRREWGDAGNAQNVDLFLCWCMDASPHSSPGSCDYLTDREVWKRRWRISFRAAKHAGGSTSETKRLFKKMKILEEVLKYWYIVVTGCSGQNEHSALSFLQCSLPLHP